MLRMLRTTFLVFTLISIVKGECPEGCDQPIAIYKDLQCKPVYENPTDCCPIKYDCPDLNQRPSDKCTLHGKSYAVGDEIPKEETYPNCKIGCRCIGPDDINCAILDCPEWLGVRPKSGNHFTYALNECCATGQKGAPYATCKVGEKEYKEGERFDGPKRCTRCVCKEGFTGKFEEPFCTENTCVEEMDNMFKIKANCAPSYFAGSCCPFRWICPNDDKAEDKIIPSASVKSNTETCKYGSKTFNVGDKIERIEPISKYDRFEIKCECVIPPLMTCNQKQVFDLENTPQHIKDALKLK